MKIEGKKPIILSLVAILVFCLFTGLTSVSGAKVSFNPNTGTVM